ncbi:MAG TPA: zinc ribbon domain-containing protein [Thermoanaerobaculia bacterium]|nr:zinc ribbon domain-containing protein [Thermoanaerobaculia bacterium]
MPIYEYDCQKCGKRTEVIQGYSDPQLKICPHCGGKKLKKAFSAPAIQFKGSGWYVTDYGKGDAGPRKKEKESDSSAKSETSAKSESSDKPEKKADSTGTEASASASKASGEKKTESKKKGKKGD